MTKIRRTKLKNTNTGCTEIIRSLWLTKHNITRMEQCLIFCSEYRIMTSIDIITYISWYHLIYSNRLET